MEDTKKAKNTIKRGFLLHGNTYSKTTPKWGDLISFEKKVQNKTIYKDDDDDSEDDNDDIVIVEEINEKEEEYYEPDNHDYGE